MNDLLRNADIFYFFHSSLRMKSDMSYIRELLEANVDDDDDEQINEILKLPRFTAIILLPISTSIEMKNIVLTWKAPKKLINYKVYE